MSDSVSLQRNQPIPNITTLKKIIERYEKPSTGRAVWQIVNTFVPLVLLWYLMYLSLSVSWWLLVPLAVLAGILLVRVFIIFHDCGHGSFFKSRIANDTVGFIAGLPTFTPYYHWKWQHLIHHGSAGNLDRRGTGDVWTMTVQEYLASSHWKRFTYRVARNPLVLFAIAPLYLFVIAHRFPSPKAAQREQHSVLAMNLAILGMAIGLSWIFGLKAYLLIQLIMIMTMGGLGVWMFYVQHQFEGVYWERNEGWDFAASALRGSSFYKLPRLLQWLTGNIGFHHIHHLSPRIPNYNLARCHQAIPLFQNVKPITLFSSLKSLNFRLWDEEHGKLVGYSYLRRFRRE
jgi:omega-6 fatty acid desaturase (delta-12 desaturase)